MTALKSYGAFSSKVAKVQADLEVYVLKEKLGRNFSVLGFQLIMWIKYQK